MAGGAVEIDDVPQDDGRHDEVETGKGKATGQSVILVGNRTLLVDSGAGRFHMRFGADVRIGPDVEMPAFEAAVRQDDGRWRTVTPTDRQLAAWRLRLFVAFGLALMLFRSPGVDCSTSAVDIRTQSRGMCGAKRLSH